MPLIPTVLAHEEGETVSSEEAAIPATIRDNQIHFTLITSAILVVLTIIAVVLSNRSKKAQPPTSATQTGPTPQPVAATVTPPIPTAVPAAPLVLPTPVVTPTAMPVTPLVAPVPIVASTEQPVAEPPENNLSNLWKSVLFFSMILVILANTVYLVGSTLYLNSKSVTNGPVHWHADFEVWDCGKEIELIDPKPPSNKVGSPLLHEHNDKEIHVEEAVYDPRNISLGAFFIVVGGDLHSDYLKFPTNTGVVERRNGDQCLDGRPGTLQVYAIRDEKDGSFSQKKLTNPSDYQIRHEQKVPPGDCLIIEFSPDIKDQTDRLCQKFQTEKEKRARGR